MSKKKSIRSRPTKDTASDQAHHSLGVPATTEVTNPFDARENLENGSVAGIGRYLHDDVGPLLRLIAERRHRPSQRTTTPPGCDSDSEFECDTADVVWAIENGHSELVDQYLRRLAKITTVLGDMLDPEGGSEHWLKPVRRKRGNPRTEMQANRESDIHRDLIFARVRLGGKLEAAISEVSEKYKCSRATLMRVWAKYEHSRTRT
jgi:hypothetical protein